MTIHRKSTCSFSPRKTMNTWKLHKTVDAVKGIFDISSTATDVTLKEGHFKGKKIKTTCSPLNTNIKKTINNVKIET